MSANRLGRWSAFGIFLIGVAYFATLAFRFAVHGLTKPISGTLCVAGIVGPAVGNMKLQLVGVLGYAGVFPVVCFMLSRLFRGPRPNPAA